TSCFVQRFSAFALWFFGTPGGRRIVAFARLSRRRRAGLLTRTPAHLQVPCAGPARRQRGVGKRALREPIAERPPEGEDAFPPDDLFGELGTRGPPINNTICARKALPGRQQPLVSRNERYHKPVDHGPPRKPAAPLNTLISCRAKSCF